MQFEQIKPKFNKTAISLAITGFNDFCWKPFVRQKSLKLVIAHDCREFHFMSNGTSSLLAAFPADRSVRLVAKTDNISVSDWSISPYSCIRQSD